MSKSQRLRGEDVVAAFRLIAECRELGVDALEWRQHLCDALRPLLGARLCTIGEGHGTPGRRYQQTRVGVVSGLDDEIASMWQVYVERRMELEDPSLQAMSAGADPQGTFSQEQLVGRRAWERSIVFNDFYRPSRCHYGLTSFHELPDKDGLNVIAVYRAADGPRFGRRERRLLALLHQELGPLLGRSLATARGPNLSSLTPRMREVLNCLLEGDSEKQVARRLGLSPTTVHPYVTALYRHFGVSSRAELLAYFLKQLRSRTRPENGGP